MLTSKIFSLGVSAGGLQIFGGGALTASLQQVTDGVGNGSVLYLSTTQLGINSYGANPVKIQGMSAGGAMLDIFQYANTAGEYSGLRIRKRDTTVRWQLLNDDNDYLTFYNNTTKVMSVMTTNQVLVGTAFTNGYYANAKMVVNNYASAVDESGKIGLFAASQATLNTIDASGVYGHGYTNGSANAAGVVGEGKVTSTFDASFAYGVKGYSTNPHASGINVGLYGSASGAVSNYALLMDAGNILSNQSQVWYHNGITFSSTAAVTINTALALSAIDGTSYIQSAWQSASPAGAASKTTLWFDATGRMNWRPGTGGASFVRTFDATGITADRVYTLPDATTTLAGLGVAQTFTQDQTFNGTNGNIILKTGNIVEMTRNSANYFHSSSVGGDFRWTVNGNTLGSYSMNLTNAGNLLIGTTSASARIHVRGDGTNSLARFENGAGTKMFEFKQWTFGAIMEMEGVTFRTNTGSFLVSNSLNNTTSAVGNIALYDWSQSSDASSIGTSNYFRVSKAIIPGAGSANFRNFIVEYTINASGAQSGTATGIFLNATETALNGMIHNLIDLQVSGVSKFSISRTGLFTNSSHIQTGGDLYMSSSGAQVRFSLGSKIASSADGVLTMLNFAESSFNRLTLGGTTSSYCSIKRNGTAVDIRLADDSAYTNIKGKLTTETNYTAGVVVSTGYLTLYDATGTAYRVLCLV